MFVSNLAQGRTEINETGGTKLHCTQCLDNVANKRLRVAT